jgi:hypothetical protein
MRPLFLTQILWDKRHLPKSHILHRSELQLFLFRLWFWILFWENNKHMRRLQLSKLWLLRWFHAMLDLRWQILYDQRIGCLCRFINLTGRNRAILSALCPKLHTMHQVQWMRCMPNWSFLLPQSMSKLFISLLLQLYRCQHLCRQPWWFVLERIYVYTLHRTCRSDATNATFLQPIIQRLYAIVVCLGII